MVGPFHLISFAVIALVIYVAGFYFIFKNKLGIIGFLTILFFPFVGSLGIVLYSLINKDSSAKNL